MLIRTLFPNKLKIFIKREKDNVKYQIESVLYPRRL